MVVRDVSDQRLSRDTFYSSTATDRFRLSTGSDGAGARPQSPGDECYTPEVFQTNSDASESFTVVDHSASRRSHADAVRPSLTVTMTDASTDDANPVFDAPCIDSSLLMLRKRRLLRFAYFLIIHLDFSLVANLYINVVFLSLPICCRKMFNLSESDICGLSN